MSGHAAREYALGKEICGVPMPEGLKENDKFHTAIITEQQKRIMGNTMPIFQERTFCQKFSEEDYLVLKNIPETYFKRTEIAASRGLILVDTKYEFGKTKEKEL
jgi:phosphoribosylaminoimidazole-succinocarboxamide synthase